MTEPAPLHRTDDPETSIRAAKKAVRASGRAIEAVRAVMADGTARTDEAISRAVRAEGTILSPDTIRHARKALAEAGALREDGIGRTETGTSSRLWVRSW